MKTFLLIVTLLASISARAGSCRVEWPAEAIQKWELLKTVENANYGAKEILPVITAPGFATITFKDSKGRPKKVAVAYEHRSTDCLGGDKKASEELLRNPTLFRVLSYAQMMPTAK